MERGVQQRVVAGGEVDVLPVGRQAVIVHIGEPDAFQEGPVVHDPERTGQAHGGDVGAAPEVLIPDLGDAAGDLHFGDVLAVLVPGGLAAGHLIPAADIELAGSAVDLVVDVGVGDRAADIKILDGGIAQRGVGIVDADELILGLEAVIGDVFELGAAVKGHGVDGLHLGTKAQPIDAAAVLEAARGNGGDAGGDGDGAGCAGAAVEAVISKAGKPGGQLDLRKTDAIIECPGADAGETAGHGEGVELPAALKGGVPDGLKLGAAVGDHLGKCRAAFERGGVDGGKAVGQNDGAEGGAVLEGVAADRLQDAAAGEGDRRQGATAIESGGADGHCVLGDGDGLQGRAVIEAIVWDVHICVLDADAFQLCAPGEGVGSQLGDRRGDRHALQLGEVGKGVVADGGSAAELDRRDLVPVLEPHGPGGLGIVVHCPGALDDQGGIHQSPGQVRAAGSLRPPGEMAGGGGQAHVGVPLPGDVIKVRLSHVDPDVRQLRAIVEGVVPDLRDRGGQVHRLQGEAVLESIGAHVLNALLHHHGGDLGAQMVPGHGGERDEISRETGAGEGQGVVCIAPMHRTCIHEATVAGGDHVMIGYDE